MRPFVERLHPRGTTGAYPRRPTATVVALDFTPKGGEQKEGDKTSLGRLSGLPGRGSLGMV